jgi:signal transduction histidine kinase
MIDYLKAFFSLFFIIFLPSGIVFGQTSAQKELATAIDSATFQIENRLPDSQVLPMVESIRKKASDHNLYFEYATSYLLESNQHFLNSNWEDAIKAAEKALDASKKIVNPNQKTEVKVKALNSIGYVYSYQGDFAEGLSVRLKALQIAEKGHCSKKDMGNLLSWIADDYRHLDQHDKAIDYLEKTSDFLPDMANEGVIDYYYTFCQSLTALGKDEEARQQLAELDAFIVANTTFTAYDKNVANLQSSKLHGEFALKDKNYTEAITYYQKYLHHSNLLKSDGHIAVALNKIARAYQSSGDTKQALNYFKQSYDACLKDGSIDYAFKNANSIASIYAENNDFKNAFEYSQTAFELKDSLNSTERIKELHFLEAKFQAGKKEKEITELKLTNAEQELTVTKQNRILLLSGFITSGLLIILGFLYYTNHQKRIIAEKEKQSLEQQQQVISLQAMINGQETERTRIAKDLHDSMGGTFSTIKMHLSTLEHQVKDEEHVALLEKCIGIVGNAATEVRRIAYNMMPEVLIKLGLLHSIEELAVNISSSKQLKVTFQHFGLTERLTSPFEIMLYRIVQELLNNIIKHSDATEAIIQFIKEGNRLNITVEDNGKGFSDQVNSNGMGLNSVKERVHYLKGKLSIDSEASLGTTVMMEFLLAETA